jgi:hypothetical protein
MTIERSGSKPDSWRVTTGGLLLFYDFIFWIYLGFRISDLEFSVLNAERFIRV